MKQSLQSLTLVVCWQIVWFRSSQGLVSLHSSYDYETHLSVAVDRPLTFLGFYGTKIENGGHFFHMTHVSSLQSHVTYHTRFELRQNYVISQTRMNWNLSIACTNLWLLTSSYFCGILNYFCFPNSVVNYFLKLKLNWNLDGTHKSVITD